MGYRIMVKDELELDDAGREEVWVWRVRVLDPSGAQVDDPLGFMSYPSRDAAVDAGRDLVRRLEAHAEEQRQKRERLERSGWEEA